MTEREKMLAGELYDCGDKELLTQWHKAKNLTRDYNNTDSENLAEKDVTQLKAKGFPNAQIITKDQRYRVSIANYTDKQEATKQRDLLATQLGQSDIWIMLY